MQRKFLISVLHDDAVTHDPQTLAKLFGEACLEAMPDAGKTPPQVDVTPFDMTKTPRVILTIQDGRADIAAVDGIIRVVHADLDREGETLLPDEVDNILELTEVSGTPEDYEKAHAEAREGLEKYLPEIVGYQIVNADGYNIHGDEDDPFNLSSFAILTDAAVETAKAWTEKNPGYKVTPVYTDDVEEPEFVSVVSLKNR